MLSRRSLLQAAFVATPLFRLAAAVQTPSGRFTGNAVLQRIVERANAEGWRSLPIGELMGKIAHEFAGTPYVAYTLEVDDTNESCVVNLEGLDCVTFFESTLDLARAIKKGNATPEGLLAEVRHSRYRGGKQNGYASRLHYTSDWIWDNSKKGVVKDLTPTLPGAAQFTQPVGYMTKNPASYRQLKAHPDWVPTIADYERQINARSMCYLPGDKIAEAEPLIQTGDIIGITTTEPGIDVAHTGLAIRDEEGLLHFMDASSAKSRMKVTLEGRLSESVRYSKKLTGIMVARPLEPRLR